MAEASSQLTVTPKLLGKHLRDVRRKKGLSLSEVARGAGLSRRELVAYERGKVPIPESDLWVLAGSCGVDVAELMPQPVSAPELAAGASTTIGDTVAQLRRGQDDAGLAPYLATLTRLRELPPGKRIPVKDRALEAMADALGREPAAIEQRLQRVMQVTPEEATRLREIILPPVRSVTRPRALEAPAVVAPMYTPAEMPAPPAMPIYTPPAFLDTPIDAATGNVDVFEELARLPEPLPLGDPGAPLPDMLATQPPPEGTVELVDGLVQPVNAATGFNASTHAAQGFAGTPPEPVFVDSAAALWNAAEAPPIDVAQRQGSDTWDWGEAPATPLPSRTTDPGPWEDTPWQPPAPPGSDSGAPPAFWEGTDDWKPIAPESSLVGPEADAWTPAVEWATADAWTPVEDSTLASAFGDQTFDAGATVTDPTAEPVDDVPAGTWATTDWETNQWGAEAWTASVDEGTVAAEAEPSPWAPDDPWTAHEWPQDLTGETALAHDTTLRDDRLGDTVLADAVLAGPTSADSRLDDRPEAGGDAPWEHQPDPKAVSTGFYVDWGTPEPEAAPAPWEAFVGGSDPDDLVVTPIDTGTIDTGTFDLEAAGGPAWAPAPIDDHVETPPLDGEPTPIMWRADPVPSAFAAFAALGETAEPEPEPEPEPEVEVEVEIEIEIEPSDTGFVSAGNDWQLGNAVPLVEVRGEGALVMRRADERWALADVTTAQDFIVEIDADFRSGPGLGVLFRAGVDEAGRMSGYSFDIDPIYDGGGYLVRQWQADRELWNPIARVASADPSTMYGSLTVRLVVIDDHLTALVNGVEVLTVESLKQASTDRGREAATGDRVGVQAWSSSDLVIDTLRVARH